MRSEQTPVDAEIQATPSTAEWLGGILPVIDWTAEAVQGKILPMIGWTEEDPLDAVMRGLSRSERRHLLITGPSGVGKTTLIKELARRVADGLIPNLRHYRIVAFDTRNVGPEDSRACLESIFSIATKLCSADLIICIEGLASVLRRSSPGTNLPLLRAMISRPGLKLIGTLSPWEYQDLLAGDAEVQRLFTRIDVTEPSQVATIAIAQRESQILESRFQVRIDGSVVERAVTLSSTFLLNEVHPNKCLRLLTEICEGIDYERRQFDREKDKIEVADVIVAIAERTGIPISAIAGEDSDADLENALKSAVCGQDGVVLEVANELRLIQAGLNEAGKPATVLMFAGMTGVGKTELAKRVAELYSTSRRLQVYSMGNFTEPHSVSGIIGVPPGYVGHDAGGRLINELNADPYAVFLLDEAEKCHPNIWKPFLHLFDEGWIADQRGVKAYADRAIFILTTNAGDRDVAQFVRDGKSSTEIAEHVRQILSRIRLERSSQPVFPPQFLSRIQRILVFRPLTATSMVGIAERASRRLSDQWFRKREKQIVISRDVIEAIGQRAHLENERSQGTEGGRIVRKLIRDYVESRLQTAAIQKREAYRACSKIFVSLGAGPVDTSGIDRIVVEFDESGVESVVM